jgi:hypothetical protein
MVPWISMHNQTQMSKEVQAEWGVESRSHPEEWPSGFQVLHVIPGQPAELNMHRDAP